MFICVDVMINKLYELLVMRSVEKPVASVKWSENANTWS